MFASAIRLRARDRRQSPARCRFRAARAGSLFWNGLGFLTTVGRDRARADPAGRHGEPDGWFFVQVFVGSFGFLGGGARPLSLVAERRRRARPRAA